MKKICPLMLGSSFPPTDPTRRQKDVKFFKHQRCLGDTCAWWCNWSKQCAIVEIASKMGDMWTVFCAPRKACAAEIAQEILDTPVKEGG